MLRRLLHKIMEAGPVDIKFEQPVNWAKRGFVLGWTGLCIAGMFLFMTALILLLPFAFVFSRLFE